MRNIQKCLAEGYEKVVVCSPDKKVLGSIMALALKSIAESNRPKVLFFQPEELILFLEQDAAVELTKEERVKGYQVKVQYQATSDEKKKAKRGAVAQVIVQAIKR